MLTQTFYDFLKTVNILTNLSVAYRFYSIFNIWKLILLTYEDNGMMFAECLWS